MLSLIKSLQSRRNGFKTTKPTGTYLSQKVTYVHKNIYVDHINITDKDSATSRGDLVFFPHTKPTWPGKSGH